MPTIKEKAGKKSCCMNSWAGRTEVKEEQRSRNEKEEKVSRWEGWSAVSDARDAIEGE